MDALPIPLLLPRSGPRERAREHGLPTLSDEDLLALVLGSGHRGEPVHLLASALLWEHGGLRGLGRVTAGLLSTRTGVGEVKALRIGAALELGRRLVLRDAEERPWLPDSRAVFRYARSRWRNLEHEELWVLALDAQHRLRASVRAAQGGLHGMQLAVRDPLRLALREAASAFVLVHNHPSGDPTPSAEDLRFTERVAEAAELVGTPLVDHLIVAGDRYRSLLDDGFVGKGGGAAPCATREVVLTSPP